MKKLYLAGIVFLISLVAVTAGNFPDTDKDGVCEQPFCNKLDTCPKTACEILGLPLENCLGSSNRDSDNDGVGDACDACPNDRTRVKPPCKRKPSSSGGGSGGGGTAVGCRSSTNYQANIHENVGWMCITDNDCQTTAGKLGLNPGDYACTVTARNGGTGLTSCACSRLKNAVPQPIFSIPKPGQAQIPTEIVEMQLTGQAAPPRTQPRAPARQAPIQPQYQAEGGGLGPVVAGVVVLAVLAALAVAFLRKGKVPPKKPPVSDLAKTFRVVDAAKRKR